MTRGTSAPVWLEIQYCTSRPHVGDESWALSLTFWEEVSPKDETLDGMDPATCCAHKLYLRPVSSCLTLTYNLEPELPTRTRLYSSWGSRTGTAQYCFLNSLVSFFHALYWGHASDVFLVDFVKLQHALSGLYIWELLCGFWFDVRLLQRRPHGPSLLAKWVRLPFPSFYQYCASI